MVSNQKLGFHLNTRFIVYGIVVWWLAMLIVFTIIAYRLDRHKDRLKASGIALTNEFSELVSLPLLEKNDKNVHSLLTDAANKKNIIYASVVDHRNKVIAFTGTGHLLPDLTESDQSVENLSGKADWQAMQDSSILHRILTMPALKSVKFLSGCQPAKHIEPEVYL